VTRLASDGKIGPDLGKEGGHAQFLLSQLTREAAVPLLPEMKTTKDVNNDGRAQDFCLLSSDSIYLFFAHYFSN
jgi:hypothetical protein